MKKKILLFSLVTCCIFAFYSCGLYNESMHNNRLKIIEQEHEDCLKSAQTEEEKKNCNEDYEAKIKTEEDNWKRYDFKASLQKYKNFQEYVLLQWGYSSNEAKSIADNLAKETKKEKKNSGFTFDEHSDYSIAIDELLQKGYSDKKAIAIFNRAINQKQCSMQTKDVLQQYYEGVMYANQDCIEKGTNLSEKNSKILFPISNCLYLGDRVQGVVNDVLKDLGCEEKVIETIDKEPKKEKPIEDKPKIPTDDNYNTEKKSIDNLIISGYALNKATLSQNQQTELDKAVKFLKKYPNAKITIFGHTCNIGTEENNYTVGSRRAEQAKEYLMNKGISSQRINIESKATKETISDNDTEKGRLQNRRISFKIN